MKLHVVWLKVISKPSALPRTETFLVRCKRLFLGAPTYLPIHSSSNAKIAGAASSGASGCLGGMAGGGMGFIFDPKVKAEAKVWLQAAMIETKTSMETRLPFAMTPVVYDFEINDRGTWCDLLTGDQARMPIEYYALQVPGWLKARIPRPSSIGPSRT